MVEILKVVPNNDNEDEEAFEYANNDEMTSFVLVNNKLTFQHSNRILSIKDKQNAYVPQM